MTEEKEKKEEKQIKRKKENGPAEEPLPFCTTAPSAEHLRAVNEDEPCDDATAKE
ncbi:MAG: hypothetical protein JJE15_06385 [Desulfobacteraceae bacterium]|nr:hypothetical protein [Desulfobacteraceae bacterium]